MFRTLITNRACAAALLAAGVAIVAGCASDKREVAAPPVQTTTKKPPAASAGPSTRPQGLVGYRAALEESKKQIDNSLASLATLSDPATTDLRAAYDKYVDNVARMRQHEQTLKAEADAMRASRPEYFNAWDRQDVAADNPTIRASVEARRKRLRDAHERIATTTADARDAYVPFMKDLEDIRKYLAGNLTKQSVADLGDASRKVQASGTTVKARIDTILATLDTVEKGV